MKDKN